MNAIVAGEIDEDDCERAVRGRYMDCNNGLDGTETQGLHTGTFMRTSDSLQVYTAPCKT